ncbi:putative integral membrane protein (apicoplast) [Theileria parva strain Muguga]|uniref:Uncharacterized protein n=1 Tax=Theileria parva TaxID=5875 RepID=Q4MY92_THEPA|nr:putative integral membrane protein [Theileria parva strain Muguga]|eukprot:XP_762700.1 hypothetical protein (apicoplast) [Theileria parva strain Muguga]
MNFFYIIPFYIRHIFSYANYILLTFYMPYLKKPTESLFVEPTFRSIEKFFNFLSSCLKLMGFIRLLICIFKLLLKI